MLLGVHSSSEYVWLPKSIVGECGNIPTSKLLPTISTPFETTPLSRLMSVLKRAMKHNFMSSVLVLSGGFMSLHYIALNELFSGCPVVVATGEPETGKSTTI